MFLNKFDLLQKKLEAGIKANEYLTNYGDRPNDPQLFAKCTFPFYFLVLLLRVDYCRSDVGFRPARQVQATAERPFAKTTTILRFCDHCHCTFLSHLLRRPVLISIILWIGRTRKIPGLHYHIVSLSFLLIFFFVFCSLLLLFSSNFHTSPAQTDIIVTST